MRLNGLGAPDQVSLVPLNKIESAQSKPEDKPAENNTQNTKRDVVCYCNKFGHFKAECRKIKKDKWLQICNRTAQTKAQTPHSNVTLAANPTKRTIVGMEPMLPTIHDLSVTTNKYERRITPSNQRQLKLSTNQKFFLPRPRFGETVDARAYSVEDPPN